MSKNTKKSAFEQISFSEIPKEWEIVKLGDDKMYAIIMGQSPPSYTYNTAGVGLPFLQGKMEFCHIYPFPTIFCKKPIKIVEENDILISVRAPVGDVNISHDKVCIGRGLASIRCKPDRVNYLFLFYSLKNKAKELEKISAGSIFKAIRRDDIGRITIFLPPLPEQKKIVEVLSTVDQAVEKVDEAIEKTQRLKKGLMQELLTKGIGHREFKETEIGKIPKEWEMVSLGEILKLCQYGLSVKMYQGGKYRIVKMDDIVDGYVVPDGIKFVDLDNDTFTRFRLEKGDILFNRTNSYELVGRTGIFLLDGEYVFASYLIRLKPKSEIMNSFFLTFYLVFSGERLRQLATRAVHQANINATNIQKIKLPLPSLSEQEKIVEILSTVDNRFELLRKKKERLERIKKGLMNDLLTGRVRVINLISKNVIGKKSRR